MNRYVIGYMYYIKGITDSEIFAFTLPENYRRYCNCGLMRFNRCVWDTHLKIEIESFDSEIFNCVSLCSRLNEEEETYKNLIINL